MAEGPETKNNLDQAPEPASPEELKHFHRVVIDKVRSSEKAVPRPDPFVEGVEITAANWVPSEKLDVHVDVGEAHEPEYVDILINENFGLVDGIYTTISKHFRYRPLAGTSEYEESLVEFNEQGRRLFDETTQHAREISNEVDVTDMNEETIKAIRHARDFKNRYKGSSALPPLYKNNLDEVLAVLARCNPFNEEIPPEL